MSSYIRVLYEIKYDIKLIIFMIASNRVFVTVRYEFLPKNIIAYFLKNFNILDRHFVQK